MNFEPTSSLDLTDRLLEVLYAAADDCIAYVYRVEGDGALRRPYALKCRPTPSLLADIQRRLGAGDYKLIIRRRRTMVFAGEFGVAARRLRS